MILALSLFAFGALTQADVNVRGTVGVRDRQYAERELNYVSPFGSLNAESTWSEGKTQYQWSLGGRFQNLDGWDLEPHSIMIGALCGGFSVKAGYQTLSWGQSFALGVADLTNPKDFRDPMTTDTLWTNLATPMINAEYLFNGGGVQLFWTPFPRANKYAANGRESDFLNSDVIYLEPADSLHSNALSASEFGARMNKIFSGGLELSLFALYHWNRTPFYQLDFSSTGLGLKPIAYQQTSYGLGFSYDLNDVAESVVVRGDLVLHSQFNQASQDYIGYESVQSFDFALGPDWTTGGGAQIALQWVGHTAGSFHDNLASVKVTRKALREKLQLEGLVVVGVDRRQSWVEGKAMWFMSHGLETSLLYDYVYGDPAENRALLRPLVHQDRLQSAVRWLF